MTLKQLQEQEVRLNSIIEKMKDALDNTIIERAIVREQIYQAKKERTAVEEVEK